MVNKDRNKIIPQMFDVRPLKDDGDLDWEKISKVEPSRSEGTRKRRGPIRGEISFEIKPPKKQEEPEIIWKEEEEKKSKIFQLGQVFENKDVPIVHSADVEEYLFFKEYNQGSKEEAPVLALPEKNIREATKKSWKNFQEKISFRPEKFKFKKKIKLPEPSLLGLSDSFGNFGQNFFGKNLSYFSVPAILILVVLLTVGVVGRGLSLKEVVSLRGQEAFASLNQGKEAIKDKDFVSSQVEFEKAREKFEQISNELNSLGAVFVKGSRFVPYFSKLSSGNYAAKAGENISEIGVLASQTVNILNQIENPLSGQNNDGDSTSLLKIFQETQGNVMKINQELGELEDNLDKVDLKDIPKEQQQNFLMLKTKLPEIRGYTEGFLSDSQIFTDVLGGNGPRKYLFLFQNNNEMRATGGFIGTYGILDIFDGRIRKFFVDGIFNPDGQLREKVIPPAPIQKISANWSLHDSNWWPNFPTSAEKARWFYEKTGGPTVDGVIAMTPVVMQKLLEVTGPIEMSEYGVTIDENNFIEKVQNEVEVDYDKELNQPKKILADLAPKILDRIFNTKDLKSLAKTANIFLESLNEKHILIYSTNYDIEKKIAEKGWSGEIISTEKDYLSVINTNINGYKTDGVISENIEHESQIQEDGSIIDTVTIIRQHNGGFSNQEWFNKVNADYMRVYVPKGSKLLSAEGQSREFNSPPLDYKSLGFKKDAQVAMEEDSAEVDEATGTRIYEDSGKTVFGNWVYVSPQETVTMKYQYLLPFKINFENSENSIGTYSLLAQKQSGSSGSGLVTRIDFPEKWEVTWIYPENGKKEKGKLEWNTDLKMDKFQGVALRK